MSRCCCCEGLKKGHTRTYTRARTHAHTHTRTRAHTRGHAQNTRMRPGVVRTYTRTHGRNLTEIYLAPSGRPHLPSLSPPLQTCGHPATDAVQRTGAAQAMPTLYPFPNRLKPPHDRDTDCGSGSDSSGSPPPTFTTDRTLTGEAGGSRLRSQGTLWCQRGGAAAARLAAGLGPSRARS